MATFDAVALATAIGHRAPGLRLKIGPLAVGVRSPVCHGARRLVGGDPHGQRGRARARCLQPGDRVGMARPRVGAQRLAHARGGRVPARDPGRRALQLRRSPCAHPRLSPASPAARHAHHRGGVRPRDDPRRGATCGRGRPQPRSTRARPRRSRDRRRRGGGCRPNRPGPGGLGAGRAGAGRRSESAARRAAGGLPRGSRIRRDVQCARVLGARRPRAPGRTAIRARAPYPVRAARADRRRSARSRTSSRASAPTTTPAPTSSASCRPPPRTPAGAAC